MRRVSVIASSSGAGKTTFARSLASCLDVPFIELDALHWQQPNWVLPERDAFRARVTEATRGDAWVVDGNYSQVRDIVWGRADTVVWLDIPLPLSLLRIVRRTIARVIRRETLWGSNRETLANGLFSRDSLLWFALRTYRGRRGRLRAALASPELAHLRLHRFGSNRQADGWRETLCPVAPVPLRSPEEDRGSRRKRGDPE